MNINANVLSIIEHCEMYKNYSSVLPEYKLITERYLDNDTSKEDIILAFSTCIRFDIREESIICYFNITDTDKEVYFNEAKKSLKIWIKILSKHYNNLKYKDSIIEYCKLKNLNWILAKLEFQE